MRINLKRKFLYLFISQLSLILNLSAQELNKTDFNFKSISENKELNNKVIKGEYILGQGDTLFIGFENIKLFSKEYIIDRNGYLLLPEIYKFYAEGLTINELENQLSKSYKKYIKNPKVLISIVRYRPLSVFVSGEVKKPGLYNFPEKNVASIQLKNPIGQVRLFDLLKTASGITNNADLSRIEVIRQNSYSQGGGKIKATINLFELIYNGNQKINLNMQDGDFVLVSKNPLPIKEQIIAINKINLNPDFINVYVSGNVIEPGKTELKRGSSLIQAIASTGGKKVLTGNIEFLRFNEDGDFTKYAFRYDPKAKINTLKNPILMEGDIINVRKTLFGKTAEILNEVSSPILSGFGIYSIISD